ncbi:MAG: ABC transporter permease [Verrucomicrobiales bacterium]|nr:ABC transporter permease [Verrucomicrobiales bacterium]
MKPAPTSALPLERGVSLGRDAWRRLCRNRLALVCLYAFGLILAACMAGPWLSPYDPAVQDLALKAAPPSGEHWMGTDDLGRDVATRVLCGGRVSLAVGLAATLVALVIGVVYGATAGYVGGKVDGVMMRLVDILYGVPFIIFIILVKVVVDEHIKDPTASLVVIFLVIGAVEWLTMARIVRGQVLSLRKMEFVEAAESLGLGTWRIIRRHVIPNTVGPVIIYTTLTVPAVMLTEAALSFLGLGIKPPDSSWGVLIQEGAAKMETYPWMLVFPAVLFAVTLFCLNFIGDGLRNALDVRSAKD